MRKRLDADTIRDIEEHTQRTKGIPIDKLMERESEFLSYVAGHVWNPELDSKLTAKELAERFQECTTERRADELLTKVRKSIRRIKNAKIPYGLTPIEQIAWSDYHKKPVPFDAIFGNRSLIWRHDKYGAR